MDIGKNLQASFDLYTKNFVTLLLAGLIAGVLSGVTFGILAGPLCAGVLVLSLKLLKGEKAEIGEVFAHFDQFVPTFIVTLLVGVAMIVAFIIFIIPVIGWLIMLAVGPVIGLVYILALGAVVENKMEPVAAIKAAINRLTSAKDPVMIWVYSLIVGILAGIGGILLGVGAILTMPFGFAGWAVAYRELTSGQGVSGDTPTITPGA